MQCATILGDFANEIEADFIGEVASCFKPLLEDNQEGIRLICIETLIPLAKFMNNNMNRQHTLTPFMDAFEDRSWKVRLSIAKNFHKLIEAFDKELTEDFLIERFMILLKDPVDEVRSMAIYAVKNGCENIDFDKLQGTIIPLLIGMGTDSSIKVKSALGDILCELSRSVRRETATTKFVPVIIQLLKDDSPEVKLSVLKKIEKMGRIVGPELVLMGYSKYLKICKKIQNGR